MIMQYFNELEASSCESYAKDFALYLYKNKHLNQHFCMKKIRASRVYPGFLHTREDNKWWSFEFILFTLGELNLITHYCRDNIINFIEKNLLKLAEDNNVSIAPRYKRDKRGKDLQFLLDDQPVLNLTAAINERKTSKLTIKNIGEDIVKIRSIIIRDSPYVSFSLKFPFDLEVETSVDYKIRVLFDSEEVIPYPITLCSEAGVTYTIELTIHVLDELFHDLQPVELYEKLPKQSVTSCFKKIESSQNTFSRGTLKMYPMPKLTTIALNSGLEYSDKSPLDQIIHTIIIQNTLRVESKDHPLQVNNYTQLLDLLLFIEEHQMLRDITDYDLVDQKLTQVGNFYELEVPGLAEQRPSLIIGDIVYVRESKNSKVLYEGYVRHVNENSVLLTFSINFKSSVFVTGKPFYVQFCINRYPLRVEHQAIELTQKDNFISSLFPKTITEKPFVYEEFSWYNRNIAENLEQQQAVKAIVNKSAMPYPYIIFGPPGTGKTITVVESVKQIYDLRRNDNILICAPSNHAADEVARRLVGTIPSTDLLRFIAASRSIQNIHKEVIEYSNFSQGFYTQIYDFTKYRIIISTLVNAARLIQNDVPGGHFDYVFIDESGQATETETLIPIAGILSDSYDEVLNGQIVLAGDPRQLGPIIHSNLAKEYGFNISMLERLIDSCDPYKKNDENQFNQSAITKLLRNYRSHPAIIHVPNKLFYDEDIIPSGGDFINLALGWEELPNPQFPIILHSVTGLDQREKNSPSYFNLQEVSVVLSYLEKLIGTKMKGTTIQEKDIAVVAPYRKQVEKIKKACIAKKCENVTVCSTEQIQGQERTIVIISAVRSKPELIKFDKKFHLGFLQNPKRFNVSITRAKALLIVIGNPNLLCYDENWKTLIQYCLDNNAVKGARFQYPYEDDRKELEFDLQNLVIDTHVSQDEGGASFSRGNI